MENKNLFIALNGLTDLICVKIRKNLINDTNELSSSMFSLRSNIECSQNKLDQESLTIIYNKFCHFKTELAKAVKNNVDDDIRQKLRDFVITVDFLHENYQELFDNYTEDSDYSDE